MSDLNHEFTFYDLLAENHYIETYLDKKGRITITVTNDEDFIVYKETSHIAAWEGLVYFAKQVLNTKHYTE